MIATYSSRVESTSPRCTLHLSRCNILVNTWLSVQLVKLLPLVFLAVVLHNIVLKMANQISDLHFSKFVLIPR